MAEFDRQELKAAFEAGTRRLYAGSINPRSPATDTELPVARRPELMACGAIRRVPCRVRDAGLNLHVNYAIVEFIIAKISR